MRAVRGFAVRNGAFLAAGLLAALPVILSTAHTLAVSWTPVGDDGMIAVRSYDVFSSHSPLVGHYSASSAVLGKPSYSLGPMLYWLLAIPARLGPAAMVLTMGVVNSAASFGAVALARRRGGAPLMIAAATVLAVMSASLVGHTYSDIWDPAAGLLPFTLLIFVAWSIGCGEARLLPLAAIVASFAIQCHLTFLLPSVGVLLVGIAGLVVARVRPSRRILIVTAAVLLVCWSGPLLDEIVHRPGNIEILVRTAFSGAPTAGFESGARAITHTAGAPPWWLSVASGPDDRLADIARAPSPVSIASAAAVLAALGALLAVAVRRRRRDVALAAALALVMCLAMGLVAGGNPTKGLLVLSLGYTLWWGTAAGAWTWLTLIIGALVLLAGDRIRWVERPTAMVGLAVLGAALSLGRLAAAGPGEDLTKAHYKPMRALAERLERALPADRTVLVTAPNGLGFTAQFDYQMGTIYALRRNGQHPVTAQNAALGAAYDPRGRRADYVLGLRQEDKALPAGAQLLMHLPRDRGAQAGIAVTLERTR